MRRKKRVCFTQGDGGYCNWNCSSLLTTDKKKVTCAQCLYFLNDAAHCVYLSTVEIIALSRAVYIANEESNGPWSRKYGRRRMAHATHAVQKMTAVIARSNQTYTTAISRSKRKTP